MLGTVGGVSILAAEFLKPLPPPPPPPKPQVLRLDYSVAACAAMTLIVTGYTSTGRRTGKQETPRTDVKVEQQPEQECEDEDEDVSLLEKEVFTFGLETVPSSSTPVKSPVQNH